MIKAVLFDLDGVIADTDRTRFDLLKVLLWRRGLELRDDEYKRSVGKRTEVFLKDLFGDMLIDEEIRLVYSERKQEYREHPNRYVIAQPHVLECCKKLHAAELLLAVASASEEKDIRMVLDELRLSDFFVGVVGSDTVKNMKPHPETYLRCMEKFGFKQEECIAVEDSPTGIRSAKGAGVYCVAVTSTHTPEELFEADAIVSSLAGLTPKYVNEIQ